jgi:hypothetical protein
VLFEICNTANMPVRFWLGQTCVSEFKQFYSKDVVVTRLPALLGNGSETMPYEFTVLPEIVLTNNQEFSPDVYFCLCDTAIEHSMRVCSPDVRSSNV